MRFLRSVSLAPVALATRAALCCIALLAAPAAPAAPTSLSDITRAQAAFDNLMRAYDTATGRWATEGWWQQANSTTIAAAWVLAMPSAPRATRALADTFADAQRAARPGDSGNPGFLNHFYDDEGWWALAWIDAYDATGRPAYLAMAKSIASDMAGGWDATCGGGLWWNKDRRYKNAITNELFLSVTARLAQHGQGGERDRWLELARRELAWFQASGLVNADHLVNDGLDQSCRNNHGATWTYNQGVILGGLVTMARIDHDPSLIDQANAVARAAIARHTGPDGVLHEAGRTPCGGDAIGFKGIFVRNLVTLARAAPNPAYAAFVARNADAAWSQARTPGGAFACAWNGPAEDAGAAATTSALAPLIGKIMLGDGDGDGDGRDAGQ